MLWWQPVEELAVPFQSYCNLRLDVNLGYSRPDGLSTTYSGCVQHDGVRSLVLNAIMIRKQFLWWTVIQSMEFVEDLKRL
jgi:hypothetical protein